MRRPSLNRRQFLGGAALMAPSILAPSHAALEAQMESSVPRLLKPRRTMYFNDARHYYLYAFEPPISMKDAWRPVDELVETSVDTLIYGVETGGGLFSDTKVSVRAHGQKLPYTSAHAWRAWYNMQSLIDRGLDPLQVLVDRAHERRLDFIISMRMGGGPRDPRYQIGTPGFQAGGGGFQERNADFSHQAVRDVRFAMIEELANYPVEGIEFDFAFTPFYFKPSEIKDHTPLMTNYVRHLSEMIRSKGKNRIVGARVFPTESMNRSLGLDVKTWLAEKLVDYVAPLYYGYFLLDPNLPFESLVTIAHASGGEVFPVMQPYFLQHGTHASPAMLRAAIANYWAKGADGLIVGPWFRWPFREEERALLTDIGDPEVVKERSKHHFVSVRQEDATALGYSHPLPLQLKVNGPKNSSIPVYVADDCSSGRVARTRLLLKVQNLVTADDLKLSLNGSSLAGEALRRTSHRYDFQWLEYTLSRVLPRPGENLLVAKLVSRPKGLGGSVTIDQVEVLVEYDEPQSVSTRPDVL